MKSVQSTLFVSILTLLLGVSVPAQAAPSLQPNTLSAHDLELLFEDDGKPMELALLSEQEMRETKGAWFYLYGQLFGGGILGSIVYFHELLSNSPGSFSWDGLTAYVTTGAIAGAGGFGYTVPGRIILSGSAALVVQHYYSPNDSTRNIRGNN